MSDAPDPQAERLLTPEEVAERLRLSPVTIGHMLRAGELPGVKVKTLWRIREGALNDYIRNLSAPPPRPPRLHKPKKPDAADPSAAATKAAKARDAGGAP